MNSKHPALASTLLAVAASAALLIGPPAGAQTDMQKIKVTIPVPALTFYPLYVGVERGYFKRQGLDVEIITTSGDGPDVDALIAGSVEFTVSTPNRLMTAAEQGKPLWAIMNLANRLAVDCWMNKDLATKLNVSVATPLAQRIQALKGQTVAGTRPGAFTYLMLVNYAKRYGLVPQKDLQIIGIGGAPAMIPAVENGQVAVACTGDPAPAIAVSRGKAVMFTNNVAGGDPAYDDFLFELLYVRPEYAKANGDIVRRMTRGFLSALTFIQEGSDADHLPILKKSFTGASDDILLAAMKAMKPVFKRDGRITEAEVMKAARFLLETGALTKLPVWSDVANNDYLP